MEVDEETRKAIIKAEMSRLGKRRWAKTTQEERKNYAKKIAKARWAKKELNRNNENDKEF